MVDRPRETTVWVCPTTRVGTEYLRRKSYRIKRVRLAPVRFTLPLDGPPISMTAFNIMLPPSGDRRISRARRNVHVTGREGKTTSATTPLSGRTYTARATFASVGAKWRREITTSVRCYRRRYHERVSAYRTYRLGDNGTDERVVILENGWRGSTGWGVQDLRYVR